MLWWVTVCSPTMQSTGSGGVEGRDRESRMFPEEGKEENIVSMALTQDFLIYSTQVYNIICMYIHTCTCFNEK